MMAKRKKSVGLFSPLMIMQLRRSGLGLNWKMWLVSAELGWVELGVELGVSLGAGMTCSPLPKKRMRRLQERILFRLKSRKKIQGGRWSQAEQCA